MSYKIKNLYLLVVLLRLYKIKYIIGDWGLGIGPNPQSLVPYRPSPYHTPQ